MWNDQGGGFEQGGGFNSPGGFGTPQPTEERKVRTRAQNLVPVTVAQIINATSTDDKFFTGSVEISQVVLIGLIRGVNETTTRVDYLLDDMTGPPLEVKQFVDNDENVPDEERMPTQRENTYVRVCGHIRAFQGKRNVTAFNISPVEDMNQLTCHLLSVMYARFPPDHKTGHGDPGTSMAPDVQRGSVQQFNQQHDNSGMSKLQLQIANIIRECNNPVGVSIQEVSSRLRGQPEKAIRDAIDFLSGEGHIYSTIDDDHFKATDG